MACSIRRYLDDASVSRCMQCELCLLIWFGYHTVCPRVHKKGVWVVLTARGRG